MEAKIHPETFRSFSDTLSEPQKSIARSETALELERESRTSPDSLQSLNSLDLECPIDFEIKVSLCELSKPQTILSRKTSGVQVQNAVETMKYSSQQ